MAALTDRDEKYEEDGTLASGYAEDGPYHCEDCIHRVNEDECSHPVVCGDEALASRKQKNGNVKINVEVGCCRFVKPPEKKKGPTSDEEE